MAGRIRTIKPELLEDEKAATLSDAAWRLFVSSWLLADDHGRFRAGARYLAAQVWQDTTKSAVAEAALAELADASRIRIYRVDGDTYAEIPTWARHQRIDNAGKEGKKVPIPTPESYVQRNSAHLPSVSPRTAETLGDSPLRPPKSAALPPTSDHGPPTTYPAPAGSEPPGSGVPPLELQAPARVPPATSSQPPGQAPLALEPPGPKRQGPAELVFAAYVAGWKRVNGPNRKPPTLEDKRRRLVTNRLRDFPLEDLIAAAGGIWLDPWSLEDVKHRVSFEIALRDSAHIEKFREAGGASVGRSGRALAVEPAPGGGDRIIAEMARRSAMEAT